MSNHAQSRPSPRTRGLLMLSLTLGLGAALGMFTAAAHENDARTGPAFSAKLPNVPGKSITGIVVHYAPGGRTPEHHHAGSVMAYVLSGAIRSENSATGPARVYRAGESFFEPPGSVHLVSANASETEPASLLAIFIADDDAQLTVMDE